MKITDIEPTEGHVLIELPARTDTVGELVVAGEQANNAPVRGTIIRVPQNAGGFAVGEEIFFRKYAVDELTFEEENLQEVEVYIVDVREILGVVRPIAEPEVKEDITVTRAETKQADQKLKDSVS